MNTLIGNSISRHAQALEMDFIPTLAPKEGAAETSPQP